MHGPSANLKTSSIHINHEARCIVVDGSWILSYYCSTRDPDIGHSDVARRRTMPSSSWLPLGPKPAGNRPPGSTSTSLPEVQVTVRGEWLRSPASECEGRDLRVVRVFKIQGTYQGAQDQPPRGAGGPGVPSTQAASYLLRWKRR